MKKVSNTGGTTRRQSPAPVLAKPGEAAQSASQSAARVLLSPAETARQVFGVSLRKFQDMRKAEWMPRPVVLGPKVIRYIRHEVVQALANMPRHTTLAEPAELQRGLTKGAKQGTAGDGNAT